MKSLFFQVDAFAQELFQGNPAAVVALTKWLPDPVLQQIAAENNLSETAFFVPKDDRYTLRWFTPVQEVDLCGHATLAAAHVLFAELSHKIEVAEFDTRSGLLTVSRAGDAYRMTLPAWVPEPVEAPPALLQSLGKAPQAVFKTRDYLVEYESEADIRALQPDLSQLATVDSLGVIVTAPGETVDFVSRFFAPQAGVPEDPVTGSAHSSLTPFWGNKLGKHTMKAFQASARGGHLECSWQGDRVELVGHAVTFLTGALHV